MYYLFHPDEPDTNLGKSASRCAARERDSLFIDSILLKIDPSTLEKQPNALESAAGTITSVSVTTSERTAG